MIILIRKLEIGWETWIRTKINGVRVRCSTIELFPNSRRAEKCPCGESRASIIEFAADANTLTQENAIF